RIPEAQAKAREAEASLAAGPSTRALREFVRSRLADLRLIAAFDELRARWLINVHGAFVGNVQKKLEDDYLQVFQSLGINVDAVTPEQVASKLRDGAIAIEVASALDDWCIVVRERHPDTAKVSQLRAIARAVDPDPWRNKLREILEHAKGLETFFTDAVTRVD